MASQVESYRVKGGVILLKTFRESHMTLYASSFPHFKSYFIAATKDQATIAKAQALTLHFQAVMYLEKKIFMASLVES